MRVVHILLMIMISISFIACSYSEEADVDVNYGDIYLVAFEAIMEEDVALNEGASYIAIDSRTLDLATEEDIDSVFGAMKVYNEIILDESMKSLEDKEMFIDDNYIEGILLSASDLELISDNKAVLKVSKFKSRKGAVGGTVTLERKDGMWVLVGLTNMWMS
ncbi:conserved protein of unknown function [Petrocella atlantisensis]|uniref:Uncharacterized protein n=2 Tax=Petrocella atlantisensis TaxID=2173034 RepID=A0A3P7Q171_9FIRM|nr:conserved protein of unknown function [Petrocella atlantisensis]